MRLWPEIDQLRSGASTVTSCSGESTVIEGRPGGDAVVVGEQYAHWGFADAPALFQRTPCGVSSISMPASRSWARRASAAKSRALRAVWRLSSRS